MTDSRYQCTRCGAPLIELTTHYPAGYTKTEVMCVHAFRHALSDFWQELKEKFTWTKKTN
jgi:hypothetical protein